MPNYHDLRDELAGQGLTLKFAQSGSLNIAIFQPLGALSGPLLSPAPGHSAKVREWLESCRQHGGSILVAPEMSVPVATLHAVLDGDQEVPPESLCVLPLTLLRPADAIQLLDHDRFDFCPDDALIRQNAGNNNAIVNAVAYVYSVAEDERLHFSLQLKNEEMSHSEPYEINHLVKGTGMIIVNSGTNPDRFAIVTAICADILAWRHAVDDRLAAELSQKSLVLLHPQLCANILHGEFSSHRNVVLNNPTYDRTQIVALNWAPGTTVNGGEHFSNSAEPISGIWRKRSTTQTNFELFNQNYERGLFHHWNHTLKWDVFSLAPIPAFWWINLPRCTPSSYTQATAGYPTASRVIPAAGVNMMDPFGILTVAGAPLAAEVLAMDGAHREAFISAATAVRAFRGPIQDPTKVPSCSAENDSPPHRSVIQTRDLHATKIRHAVQLQTLLQSIVADPEKWPPELRSLGAGSVRAEYDATMFTLSMGACRVAGAYIGDATSPIAGRILDEVIDAINGAPPGYACIWYQHGGVGINHEFGSPTSDITKVPKSRTSIVKRFES